jgi:RNA polymerase sigma factor (sigma-70 family)
MTTNRRSGPRAPSRGRPRRSKRLLFCADLDAFAAEAPPAGDAREREAAADEGEAVREALARALTAKQREVVEMHFFEGLSQGEIARRLGVSQQVVQKRLYGAGRDGRRVGGALPKLRAALAAQFARP